MKVGTCGICCDVCGLYVKGICPGCERTPQRIAFLKKINANCPVLECAVKRNIEICSRDCKDFPCKNFDGWPFSEEWIEMFKLRSRGE